MTGGVLVLANYGKTIQEVLSYTEVSGATVMLFLET